MICVLGFRVSEFQAVGEVNELFSAELDQKIRTWHKPHTFAVLFLQS